VKVSKLKCTLTHYELRHILFLDMNSFNMRQPNLTFYGDTRKLKGLGFETFILFFSF